jgi:MFS family permease
MERINKLNRNIVLIQFYFFFRSFVFAYVIERLFWRSRGISITDTVYIEIIYSIVIILLEIPSGVWADRFSRKTLIVLGSLIYFSNALVMVFAEGFVMFAVLIGLSGVAGAIMSGSTNALLYDTLEELNKTDRFEKYLGKIKIIRYSSGLLAALIGSLLAHFFQLVTPYQLSVVSMLFMVICALFLVEPTVNTEEEDEHINMRSIVKLASKTLMNNKYLKYIFIVGASIGASSIYIDEFWQNYADSIHIPLVYFGLISGAFSLSVIFASSKSDKFISFLKGRSRKVLYNALMIISMLAYLSLGLIKHPIGLLFMLLAIMINALLDIFVMGDLHREVPSQARATMESAYSMFSSLLSAGVGLAFGYACDKLSINAGYTAIAVILLFAIMIKDINVKKVKTAT